MIESYRFGEMVVDGRTYTADLIILPGKIVDQWWRKEGHHLTMADLPEVVAASVDQLVVGCGASGMMKVDQALIEDLESRHITLTSGPTGEMWRRYNDLRAAGAKVAGAFHLTC